MRVTNNGIVLCNLCLEDVETEEPLQATHYCNDCNKNLCNGHLQLHKSKKITKDHSLSQLITSDQPSISSTSFVTTSTATNHYYCKEHQDQVIDIYCKDCDVVICIRCAAFLHKSHNYVDVKEIIKEEEEQKVNNLLKDLNIKKEIILQRNEKVNEIIVKVKEQLELNKNEIKQYCNDLHKCIDNKMEQLLLEVDKIGNEKLQSLQNENNLLNECHNNLNFICQLKNDNAIDILQNKFKLQKEINNLNKINVLNNLNSMNNFKFNEFEKNNLINLINTKFGTIENKEIKIYQALFNNSNFDLIKFDLISKFGGTQGNDKLNFPWDLIYNNNLIYIADTNNKRILILDNLFNYKNEIKLKFYPYSLALNKNYLFIGCTEIIYKYNLNTLQLITEIKSNEKYKFNYIYGMTCDLQNNNLYICNLNTDIIILNENEEFIRKFNVNNYLEPHRIIINKKEQIVITCKSEIRVYDKFGNFILNINFKNSNLYGIINDKNDNYIICDYNNSKLLLLDNEFKIKKEFIKNLNIPIGITLNELNNEIYIVEESGSNCCKLFK